MDIPRLLRSAPSFAIVVALVAGAAILYWLLGRRRAKVSVEFASPLSHRSSMRHAGDAPLTLQEVAARGEIVPDTIHPVIDLDRCIGSGACVRACPEKNVLGIVHGQAHLLNPLACVGHSACLPACPVEAIRLVFGSAERGVELPMVDPHFQTTREGVYVIGELGGMGLIRNAVRQGRQAADHVARGTRRGKGGAFDAAVVGGGPAGVSATLRLMEARCRVVLLERDSLGGSIVHYPRAKVVMTGTLEFPLIGSVRRRQMSKEDLVELWRSIAEKSSLPVKTGVTVEGVAAEPDGMWRLETSAGPVRAANVLLGVGRRGSPRKLGVVGEDLPKVHYTLIEPDPFRGKHVLVVGGGNSAVENALALADFGGCASVTISYRRGEFARCRPENRQRIQEAIRAGKVRSLLPSEVKRIAERDVALVFESKETIVPNDAVIIQIGGTAPAELLGKFGIEVVVKRGEA